jgi:signal transduction histidine kinase
VTSDQERFRVLADTAAALAGEFGLETVLHTIVEGAARLAGATYAALGIVGPDETITRFITHGVDADTIREIGPYPTGKGVLGVLIRDPKIIRLDDIRAHPASYGFPANHPPMTTFLGAPVRSGGTVYGNLYLTEKAGGFTTEDEQLLMVLAAQAGAAIENALLSDRLRSLAVQEERDRISRELHDGVIQTLFSIGMGLESARSFVRTDPDRVDERVDNAVDSLDGAIRELRNYIFRLQPQEAGAMGFARGLSELAREYEVNALVRPHLDVQPAIDARLPTAHVPDLLQITREALSNTAKHAQASHVGVSARVDGAVELNISDDGIGFAPTSPKVGRGLDNIRERVAALGGELDVRSAPGQGTTVWLRVPLADEEAPYDQGDAR